MLVKDDPLYSDMHKLVRKLQGSARQHDCVACDELGITKQAVAWASIHTETGLDAWSDYVPLCMSCHMKYDDVGVGRVKSAEEREKISRSRQIINRSDDQRRKVGNFWRGKPKSPEQRAKMSEARKRYWERKRQEIGDA